MIGAHIYSFALLMMLACLSPASAATFADYQRRVRDATDAIERLTYAGDDQAQQTRPDEATIRRVRDELPLTETVLLNGVSVSVDNTWLHEALSEYAKRSGDDPRPREILARTAERLRALSERLAEIEVSQAARDKTENKARLAEILRRSEYNKQAEQGSALERLWERFLRWLASLFPETKPLQPGSARALSGIAQIVVIGISLAAIAFLIWKFGPRYLRSRGKKKQKREARIVLGEHLEPDQTAADLLAQAESLARGGDLRAAIRKAYIALLCELGDRKIISLAQHKTNRDYLNSLRERVSLYDSMRRLTNSFELHWYGFVPPGPDDWTNFRAGYQRATNLGKGFPG